jgi:hypothetical protein
MSNVRICSVEAVIPGGHAGYSDWRENSQKLFLAPRAGDTGFEEMMLPSFEDWLDSPSALVRLGLLRGCTGGLYPWHRLHPHSSPSKFCGSCVDDRNAALSWLMWLPRVLSRLASSTGYVRRVSRCSTSGPPPRPPMSFPPPRLRASPLLWRRNQSQRRQHSSRTRTSPHCRQRRRRAPQCCSLARQDQVEGNSVMRGP